MAEKQLINCLRNETVVVRHIPRESRMVGNNPRHVLFGGMAESAYRKLTVPMLRSGQLQNVLTDEEKDYLEQALGLPDNGLSLYRTENNYWKSLYVRLEKTETRLNLSDPNDYIKYKVLLANKNLVCPDLKTLQEYPKATYEYVIVAEGEESKANMSRLNARKEAYKEYGKIEGNKDILRLIVESMTARPVASSTRVEQLAEQIDTLIENDAKTFLTIVQDPLLKTKVLIRNGIEAGVIADRGGMLYMRADNHPLCNQGDPTLSVAADYLNQPKNQEMKFAIEAKVKAYKENK